MSFVDQIFLGLTAASPWLAISLPAVGTPRELEGGATDLSSLRLVVRDGQFSERQRQFLINRNEKPNADIAAPFAIGLEVVLVAENDRTNKVMTAHDLEELGLTPAKAMAMARAQVLTRLPSVPSIYEYSDAPIVGPKMEYITSLILADGWDELNVQLEGRLLVAVPSDDIILVWAATTNKQRSDFAMLAQEQFDHAIRPISPRVYTRKDKRWHVVA